MSPRLLVPGALLFAAFARDAWAEEVGPEAARAEARLHPSIETSAPPMTEAHERGDVDYEPLDTRSFVEVELGYSLPELHPAVGARVGTSYSSGFYVGGSVTYHPAESLHSYTATTPPVELRFGGSLVYLGIETGYDFQIRRVLLRPYVAVGFAVGTGHDDSTLGGAAWGGLQAIYELRESKQFFLLEARAVVTNAEADGTDGSVGLFIGYGLHLGSLDTPRRR